MHNLQLPDRPNVLAIGAHPDDIELGCAGFLHRLIHERGAKVYFAILTSGELASGREQYKSGRREAEACAAAAFLLGCPPGTRAVDSRIAFGRMRDGALCREGHGPIRFLEQELARQGRQPLDIVLTHSPDELHEDHTSTNRATLSAARTFHGTILFYQSPSTIPSKFNPSFFVQLNRDQLRMKSTALRYHVSQRGKAFLRNRTIQDITRSWAVFHRIYGANLEAFCVHQAFWHLK